MNLYIHIYTYVYICPYRLVLNKLSGSFFSWAWVEGGGAGLFPFCTVFLVLGALEFKTISAGQCLFYLSFGGVLLPTLPCETFLYSGVPGSGFQVHAHLDSLAWDGLGSDVGVGAWARSLACPVWR